MKKKQKLYAYVDESGQDTKGEIYLVSVVISGKEKEELRKTLVEIEKTSGIYARKWSRSKPKEHEKFIKKLMAQEIFKNHIFYSYYQGTVTYTDLTIYSTAKAIHEFSDEEESTIIIVDGLEKSERHRFASGLRKLKVSVHKVRGAKEQNNEFIRLADRIAGFVRDGLEDDAVMKPLLKKALRKKIIREP